jgi:hypothetical protein
VVKDTKFKGQFTGPRQSSWREEESKSLKHEILGRWNISLLPWKWKQLNPLYQTMGLFSFSRALTPVLNDRIWKYLRTNWFLYFIIQL